MKNSVLFLLGSIFVTASFTACNAQDDYIEKAPARVETTNTFKTRDARVIASGYMTAQFDKRAFTRGNFSANDITITQLTESEAKALSERKANDSGSSIGYMYAWTTLTYLCKTADGSEKELSELLVWPYSGFNWHPNQLIIGCHSTITSNAQCPSNFSNLPHAGEINMLALFAHAASQQALVIIPDYEGYGSTASSPHPYCNRELTAEQVVEGAKAGLDYFEKNVKSMEDDWKGCAIGYSQGGAVAAGVLRYCQEHKETSLRLQGALCGDGPYDPLATLKRYIEMDKLYMPVAPSLLLKGAVDTDPDMIALNCSYQDFVTENFYQTRIFDMIRDKALNTDEIQAALLDYSYNHGDDGGFVMKVQCKEGFLPYTKSNSVDGSGKKRSFELENGKGYNYCTVDQCLKPGVIEYFRSGAILGDVPEEKLKALENALAKNKLTAGSYTPGRGFTFFHSDGDEVVPYCNFESVRNTWGVNTIEALTYQSATTLHVATGTTFFVSYCGKLVDEILNGKWSPREETVGGILWTRR